MTVPEKQGDGFLSDSNTQDGFASNALSEVAGNAANAEFDDRPLSTRNPHVGSLPSIHAIDSPSHTPAGRALSVQEVQQPKSGGRHRRPRRMSLKSRKPTLTTDGGYKFITPAFLFPSDMALAEMDRERTASKAAHRNQNEDSSSSNLLASSSESDGLLEKKLPRLTNRQKLTIVMLAIANISSTTAFSCIAPFFPTEAALKGANQSQVGIIFGVFEFVMFLFAPLWGKLMSRIGSKRLFCGGLFVTGTTAILFGLLNLVPAGPMFFWLAIVIRVIEAIGDSAFLTSAFAITAHEFPGRVTTIIGVLETFSGLGFAAGPAIGGALYQLGGYTLPFLVLGGVLLTVAVISLFLIRRFDDESQPHSQGMLALIKIPGVLVMILAVMIAAMSLTFIDPTLQPHLAVFNLSPLVVGVMFLLCAATYTLTAPIWGYVVDRTSLGRVIMIFGAFFAFVSMMLIGPSPIFHMEKTLWIIGLGLVMMGLAIGALFIPTFSVTLDIAKEQGYPDSFETYGCVSGIFNSVFSFGGFFGPTVGAIAVEAIGFEWTATIIGCGHFIVVRMIILASYYALTKCRDRRISEEQAALIESSSTSSIADTSRPTYGAL